MASKSKDEKNLTPQNKTTTALQTLSPEDRRAMYGDMDSEDLSIPRLVVLQALSPEVAEGLGKAGDLFVKGINRNLGQGGIEIIPLMRNKSRMRWKALDEGGGILCQAVDGKTGVGNPGGDCETCTLKDWTVPDPKTGKLKPGCDTYQNVVCIFRKDEETIPMALSGARTKLKAMRELNNLLALELQKGRPIFSKSYLVKPVKKSNGTITYYNLSITQGNGNQVLPAEEQKKASEFFASLRGRVIHVEQTQTEEVPVHNGPEI